MIMQAITVCAGIKLEIAEAHERKSAFWWTNSNKMNVLNMQHGRVFQSVAYASSSGNEFQMILSSASTLRLSARIRIWEITSDLNFFHISFISDQNTDLIRFLPLLFVAVQKNNAWFKFLVNQFNDSNLNFFADMIQ